jgi:DivIVA domain-containing protein
VRKLDFTRESGDRKTSRAQEIEFAYPGRAVTVVATGRSGTGDAGRWVELPERAEETPDAWAPCVGVDLAFAVVDEARRYAQAKKLGITRPVAGGVRAQRLPRPGLVILGIVVDGEASKGVGENPLPAAAEQEHGFGEVRPYVPADLLDISFPVSVRGYDRRAVDAYVERVNRVIAELKVSASAPAAVRHALEQAGGKVQGLLRAAREAGEEITASARQEAEETSDRAKAEVAEFVVNASAEADRVKAEAEEILAQGRAEAENRLARAQAEADEHRRRLQEELAALREQAETRVRELQADTEAIWRERRGLLEHIRGTASGLIDLADAAAARFPPAEPAKLEEEIQAGEAADKAGPEQPATSGPEA